MRVLFLSRWYPYPPNNGSKLRIFHLLQGLAQKHDVTLLTFSPHPENEEEGCLGQACRRIIVVPWKEFDPHSWRARLGFLSPRPRAVLDTFSQEMAHNVTKFTATGDFELIIASEQMTAAYYPYFQQIPAILEDVEVGVMYEQYAHAASRKERLRYGLTWAKYRRYLARMLRHFDACTVVSEPERQLLMKALNEHGTTIEIIPNCIDLVQYNRVSVRQRHNTLIFTGSLTYEPNYEAMQWFLAKVFPSIRAEVPDVSLMITGDHASRPLPTADGVLLTGFVEDISTLIASATVSLAPIWTGAGTRLKILEAMALRTPVVATTKGAEGIEGRHEEAFLLADTPETFAQAVLRLLGTADLRHQIAARAHKLVAEKYDWATVMPRFLDLVERVAASEERMAPRV